MSPAQSPLLVTGGQLLAARLTPRGRGAVATIRVQGNHSRLDNQSPPLFQAANGRRLAEQPYGQIVFGRWGRDFTEDVVVCRVDADTLEIHGHGGDRAVDRILYDLTRCGADTVDWLTMTQRSADVLEAELQECVSRSVTWWTTEFLLYQADGRLRAAFNRLRSSPWTKEGREQAAQEISALLQWAEFGIHLAVPWRVVLTGRPNVGKSSLMNALLGYQRSIVFDQPGTTRDVVTAETALNGWPVQLSDTAGLRHAAESLEAEGIARAQQQMATADLVLEVMDFSAPMQDPPHVLDLDPNRDRPRILVAHKSDLPGPVGSTLPTGAVRVSSKTGAGLDDLQQAMMDRLVPDVPPLNTPVPFTLRQAALLHGLLSELAEGSESQYRTTATALCSGN